MNLQEIIENIKSKNLSKKITFANPDDVRILDAVKQLLSEWHSPVVCGKDEELSLYKSVAVEKLINTSDETNNVFAAKCLADWEYDGIISGNRDSTADVVRAYIKNIWTEEQIGRLSSHFLIQTSLGLFLVADAAIQADPNAEQLAEIALLTAQSALKYWFEPKVAMLSFSTSGSASHPMVEKVQQATKLAKDLFKHNDIHGIIEWELQLDTAVVPEVALLKNPDSTLKWKANILIFPDLNSGNIGYKLMQRFGWAQAIWPIIQGLKKPGNDLSRGCSVTDILDLYYITANS